MGPLAVLGLGTPGASSGLQPWDGCTGSSGSQELLTALSCIVPWLKKCNGVQGLVGTHLSGSLSEGTAGHREGSFVPH